MSGFIRPPFRLRRNRAGRSSAPPFGFAAQKRARHFAARNHPVRLSASRPWLRHPAPLFCRSRHGCAAPGPQRQNPGACRRSAPFRLRETARPVVAPAGGNVLAAPFSLCSNVAPHFPAGSAGVRSLVPRLAPRSHPGACRRSAPFRLRETARPVVAPAGGNVLAAPFSLCSNVAPHFPAGSAGVRSLVPRLAPRSHPGACRRSAPFRCAKPRWPVVAPAGGNVLATPFSLCSNVAPRSHPGACRRSAPFRCAKPRWPVVAPAGGNVLAAPFSLCSNAAPRSHPGAQLRFILKQLYASGCPFLRNFPFFSSVPHPFFASAPGRTDTQKSAAGIPRRGFNTFSVSWLYFPLPNT